MSVAKSNELSDRMTAPRTMFAKIWDDHVITTRGALLRAEPTT